MDDADGTPHAWYQGGPDDPDSVQDAADADAAALAAVESTLLDPPQSNGSLDPLARADVKYRFRYHEQPYTRVLTVLRSHYRHEKRARRLSLCGAHATVWQSASTGEIALRSYHCGMRICPRCRETHAARTKDKLQRFTATVPINELSMISLTIRSTTAPLGVQISNLYTAFKKLRKSEVWRAANPSGYAVLEITRNTDTGLWHPHLHLLARAKYMPLAKVRAAWEIATHGSWSVDIRRVNSASRERLQKYLADYLTKPPQDSVLSDDAALTEWIDAHQDRKVLLRFGRPTLADEKPAPPDPGDWHLIGTLAGIIRSARLGYSNARHWLLLIAKAGREHRDPDAGKDYTLDSAFQQHPDGCIT